MIGQELTKRAKEQSAIRKEKPADINFVTMANFDPETLPLENYFLPELEIGTTLIDFLCLLYTSPSPRDQRGSRMPSSA